MVVVAELVRLAVLLTRRVLALEALLDQLFLQAPEGFELAGDGVEGGHYPFAELALHGADRRPGAVVEILFLGGQGGGRTAASSSSGSSL